MLIMKFGVFDQNDRSGLPLAEQYEERLALAELYDRLGFHCFHMSEHHGTSLSMTPSPSVWMAALTQRLGCGPWRPGLPRAPDFGPIPRGAGQRHPSERTSAAPHRSQSLHHRWRDRP